MNRQLRQKTLESLSAVVPITIIVLLLCITITPMPLAPLMLFLTGALLLILGMGFFTLGVDMAMLPIGEYVGSQLARSGRLSLIMIACFLIGAFVTIAEPDLQVLAGQTPGVPDLVLILAVAVGVGIFLVIAFLHRLFAWSLSRILLIFYAGVFILACFVPVDFLSVAFDSGGVTTGAITVPFILSLGVGLASVGKSHDKDADADSFGMVALCSIGPILATMILGLAYGSSSGSYEPMYIPEIETTADLSITFGREFPAYAKEVALALLPILLFFLFFQLFFLKLKKRKIIRILVGMLYSFLGLTLFLTGVNVGFMPAGNYLGQQLASLPWKWALVPVGMVIGYFIVRAEPAVAVLNQQVEDVTGGAISRHTMMKGLSLGMAISVGLSMFRLLAGLPLLPFLLVGYAVALAFTFFVPPIFTAIAFDSGGVASGAMTATFLLPLAMGACTAVGGNILSDAFGIVAMVAMTPLVILQLIGGIYQHKLRQKEGITEGEGIPEAKETPVDEEILEAEEIPENEEIIEMKEDLL